MNHNMDNEKNGLNMVLTVDTLVCHSSVVSNRCIVRNAEGFALI